MLVDLPNSPTVDIREKVLQAAVEGLGDHGVRWLTQPRVAEKAGVRQSHVTYYFPRRSDLIGEVAKRYIESAGLEIIQLFQRAEQEDLGQLLIAFAYKQVKDRRRSRTLMGLLVASEEDPELKAQMVQAVLNLRGVMAHALGVEANDPKATLMQATLWGLGINNLLMGDPDEELKGLVDSIAEQTGLKAPKRKASPSKVRRTRTGPRRRKDRS